MKKLFYMVLGILSFLLLAGLVALQVNSIHTFFTLPEKIANMALYVVAYGPMIMVALWSLVYFWGKGLKILFVILTVLVIAAGVIAFGFPDLILKLFPAAV